jgi:hypothetical protein
MAKQSSTGSRSEKDVPSYFIVEFNTGSGPSYVLCQRMMVVTPGPDSLPQSAFDSLFEGKAVRAVQLPPKLGKGLTEMMALGQSGGPPPPGPAK